MDLNYITLENNKEYILLDEFLYNNSKYVVLVNSVDNEDYVLRQVIANELVGLENEEQFKEVFMYYFSMKKDLYKL